MKEGQERDSRVLSLALKLSPHQIEEIKKRREAGESCRFLARSYGVSANTISSVRCS
jgi:hypothetical protein